MAKTDKAFPKIAEANWWKLRGLFNQRVPGSVTPNYLASALSMSESSARANIIAPFKKIGIIDDDGKPTDLAYYWRDDSKYSEVCKTILDSCYPQEVRDLFHDKDQDLSGLITWFMNYCHCGEPAAKMFAAFYRLLLRADPNEQIQVQPPVSKPKKEEKVKKTQNIKETVIKEKPSQAIPETTSQENKMVYLSSTPELHINIQLHISPETTADQIDKIFESMAKHLRIHPSSMKE